MECDPRIYLETEARIIAENDTHAVIAIRVDKCFFARNLLFMAALSDLIPQKETDLAPKTSIT